LANILISLRISFESWLGFCQFWLLQSIFCDVWLESFLKSGNTGDHVFEYFI